MKEPSGIVERKSVVFVMTSVNLVVCNHCMRLSVQDHKKYVVYYENLVQMCDRVAKVHARTQPERRLVELSSGNVRSNILS